MVDDFDSADLVDSAGEHIGTIERTYVDDGGNAQFAKVKLGHVFAKHRLVPVDQIERDGDSLQVPYTRDTIEESPHIDSDDTLEGDDLAAVRSYYASDQAGAADDPEIDADDEPVAATPVNRVDTAESDRSGAPAPEVVTESAPDGLGAVRDLGDVVEVPIVEEVLVKKQVVREVLRVKKSHLSEQGIAAADLRREDVEVVSSSPDLVHSDVPGEGEDRSTS